jgi:hypothetical protein
MVPIAPSIDTSAAKLVLFWMPGAKRLALFWIESQQSPRDEDLLRSASVACVDHSPAEMNRFVELAHFDQLHTPPTKAD